MSLSIKKLKKMLNKNGFLINKATYLDDTYAHLHILNINISENFLLYIPSKYDIKIKNDDDIIKYKIEYLDVDDDGNMELEDENNDVYIEDMDFNVKPINLIKDKHLILQNIFNKLKKLKPLFNNIKYKISILYNNYICSLRRDNTFEGFLINNYNVKDNKYKILIFVDLETLYTNIYNINEDINNIKANIYKSIDSNNDNSQFEMNIKRFYNITQKISNINTTNIFCQHSTT